MVTELKFLKETFIMIKRTKNYEENHFEKLIGEKLVNLAKNWKMDNWKKVYTLAEGSL